MNRIKIINIDDSSDYFEIPYEWLPKGVQGPTLNDLESTAERGKKTGALSRVRCAEIPAATLEISRSLTQKELYPLFRLLRKVAINIYYFEKYENKFVTKKFYAQKPNPNFRYVPEDNNTDNIEYEPFTIEFAGYEDINA